MKPVVAVSAKSDKPRLLVVELWGLGDLAIATEFLKSAVEKYDVTLLAKPHAVEMQTPFWAAVRVVPFTAPWTRFSRKYNLFIWNWRSLFETLKKVRKENFDVAVSARWDPRDHVVMKMAGAKKRLGFPRTLSQIFLTRALPHPSTGRHRYEYWRALGKEIGIELPARRSIAIEQTDPIRSILFHCGASHPVKTWPLERVRGVVNRFRAAGFTVQVACDPHQQHWWRQYNEEPAIPTSIDELLKLLNSADLFIGNDSGPGHVAAAVGVPTFTIFGPQIPELFLPVHPMAGYAEGKPCRYKPCYDQCHYATPHCIVNLSEAEVWAELQQYLRHDWGDSGATKVSPGENPLAKLQPRTAPSPRA